jgi:hypothetical protein
MDGQQHISELKSLIEEIRNLGWFEPRNVSRLKDIDRRYINCLFKIAEDEQVDRGQEITFATEERSRDIGFADGSTKTKKDAQEAERYYNRSCSGLINDIEYKISSIEDNLRREASKS